MDDAEQPVAGAFIALPPTDQPLGDVRRLESLLVPAA
jgi:hypothetical protein